MRRFIGMLLLAVISTACGKEESVRISDYVDDVSAESTDNALRISINVDFRKDCRWGVAYWPSSSPDDVHDIQGLASVNCRGSKTLMFLYPDTEYTFVVTVDEGRDGIRTDEMKFRTSSIPAEVPVYSVLEDNLESPLGGYLMQWQASNPGYLTFCDMDGRVVWYERFGQAVRQAYFDEGSGLIAVMTGFRYGVNSPKFQRICSRIEVLDLEGNRLMDVDAGEDNVEYPHHDIKIMPDGNLLIFNNYVYDADLSSLGGSSDAKVYGEGFTVLSMDGKVLRSWNTSGETDFVRDTWLKPLEYDYDLLHGNSVNWDSNGDFYVTLNRYCELWKIDGRTGKVLYKLSRYGNVRLDGDFPEGGLHSAVPLSPDRVLCYENGGAGQRSHAVIYEINPADMTARIALDVTLPPEYSSKDRSNVELIAGGTMLMFSSTMARMCVFTDLEGNVKKIISRTGISYRAHYFPEVEY